MFNSICLNSELWLATVTHNDYYDFMPNGVIPEKQFEDEWKEEE